MLKSFVEATEVNGPDFAPVSLHCSRTAMIHKPVISLQSNMSIVYSTNHKPSETHTMEATHSSLAAAYGILREV